MDIKHFITHKGKVLEIPPIDELCEIIKIKFDEYQQIEQKLKNELDRLKDEKWKDEELIRMKQELQTAKREYRNGFPISDDQVEAINEWIENHEKEKHSSKRLFPRGGAIGGSYSYIFTPTSIGVFGTVKCTCGESFEFQDGTDF